ncbi:myb-related transcription factor, partner of profilin-like [Ambystoma mexicanum]|uniref:myb-related transcription factor, partner of profilin-like n=1 Tax=Ambystoma mexicanum TaxID=8296 RepID=UPI0037E72135
MCAVIVRGKHVNAGTGNEAAAILEITIRRISQALEAIHLIRRQKMSQERTRGKSAMDRVRKPKFSDQEFEVLVDEALTHHHELQQRKTSALRRGQIWKSVAQRVSAVGRVPRDGEDCRKRLNDLRVRVALSQAQCLNTATAKDIALILADSQPEYVVAKNLAKGHNLPDHLTLCQTPDILSLEIDIRTGMVTQKKIQTYTEQMEDLNLAYAYHLNLNTAHSLTRHTPKLPDSTPSASVASLPAGAPVAPILPAATAPELPTAIPDLPAAVASELTATHGVPATFVTPEVPVVNLDVAIGASEEPAAVFPEVKATSDALDALNSASSAAMLAAAETSASATQPDPTAPSLPDLHP